MTATYTTPETKNSKVQPFIFRHPKLMAYGSAGILGASAVMSSMTSRTAVLPWITFVAYTAFIANRKSILRRAILKRTIEGALASHTGHGLVEYSDIRPSLEGAFDIIYALADTQCTGYLKSAWIELQTSFLSGKETIAGQCPPNGTEWKKEDLPRALADCSIYMNLMTYELQMLESPPAMQNYIAESHPEWLAEYPQHFTTEALDPIFHGRLATAWFVHDTYLTKEERRAAMAPSGPTVEVALPDMLGGDINS